MQSSVTITLGTCYVDINAPNFPFGKDGILAESASKGGNYELIAGGSPVNFCRMLTKLGLEAAFIGTTGQDAMGAILEDSLRQAGIKPLLVKRPSLLTNISFTMTNPKGAHIICAAGTANGTLSAQDVMPRLREFGTPRFLYLGGCFKLEALAPAFQDIITLANQQNITLIIDHGRVPAGTSADILQQVKNLVLKSDYYFPSRDEFCQLWDVTTPDVGLRLLAEQAPTLRIIVKDGPHGAYYFEEGEVHHTPAIALQTVGSVTGAGDSFNAGFIYAITRRRSVSEATKYACAVAAAHISQHPLPSL